MADTTGNQGTPAAGATATATGAAAEVIKEAVKQSPNWMDLACIVGAAIVCSLVAEAISWFLVYRHEDYKKICDNLMNAQDALEAE